MSNVAVLTPVLLTSRNEPVAYESSYVTFPAYRESRKSKQIASKCARKIKSCLKNAGNKLLGGLKAVGNFYAKSGQKREGEPRAAETSSRLAADATKKSARFEELRKAEKLQQKNWTQKLQSPQRPEPAGPAANHAASILTPSTEDPATPPISPALLEQNTRRPAHIQPAHQPAALGVHSGRTLPRAERSRPAPAQHADFAPPERRMYAPRRRNRSAFRAGRQAPGPSGPECRDGEETAAAAAVAAAAAAAAAGEAEAEGRGGERGDDEREEEEEQQRRAQDRATPWSGLQAVVEEDSFDGEAMVEDGRLGGHGRHDGGVDGDCDGEEECDGLEADGGLCMRHKSCIKEAMALGGA